MMWNFDEQDFDTNFEDVKFKKDGKKSLISYSEFET